jgi:hypothetical protein
VPLERSDAVDQAAWWVDVLHPFAHDVGSVIPDVFPRTRACSIPSTSGGFNERGPTSLPTTAASCIRRCNFTRSRGRRARHDDRTTRELSTPGRAYDVLCGSIAELPDLMELIDSLTTVMYATLLLTATNARRDELAVTGRCGLSRSVHPSVALEPG